MKYGEHLPAGGRERILLVTERILYPVNQGYRARIVELIRSLRSCGFRVTLVSRRIPSRRAWLWTRLLVDELITVDAPPFRGGSLEGFDPAPYTDAVIEAIRADSPVAVIAEYLWMAPCLASIPSEIERIVDTHDLMHVRRSIYGGIDAGAWVECTREEEARLLANASVVMAIQRNERERFRELLPGRRVICVPHACAPVRSRWPHLRRDDIVSFVGSDNAGNVEGILRFLESGWPRVRARRPAAELRVFGKVVKRIPAGLPGVRRTGPVRRLRSVYAPARVVINPVTIGTGLKIKSVEAMAHGRALVTTACGADGLEDGIGSAFLVRDGMGDLAESVGDLLEDGHARGELERGSLAYVERNLSRAACLRELLAVFGGSFVGEDDPRLVTGSVSTTSAAIGGR